MIDPISTPPAVPSDKVGSEDSSSCLPFFMDSYITQEFLGETPYILIVESIDFKYPPTPEMRPPPPTEMNTASIFFRSFHISNPIVP